MIHLVIYVCKKICQMICDDLTQWPKKTMADPLTRFTSAETELWKAAQKLPNPRKLLSLEANVEGQVVCSGGS